MVLSWAIERVLLPIRFAGTWRQYSKNAIPQLTMIANSKFELVNFRCPYQANVIKTLAISNKNIANNVCDIGRII